MLTFDKIKLVTTLSDITINDKSVFVSTVENETITALKYHQDKPYLLNIKIDYTSREVVIEFTGKVLGRRYKELISIKTIRDCFSTINDLGFCTIDIDSVLGHAEVVQCDVTSDVDCDNVPQLCSYIRSHISNYNQFKCSLLWNGNLTIERNVTTKKYKRRMVIYDKALEMAKKKNRAFVEANEIQGDFDGKCRLEVNLNSKRQIRDNLGISDNNIMTVLSATLNPIRSFLSEAIRDTSPEDYSDRKTYFTYLVLRDCDYDLAKVEAKMRELYRKGTNISMVMQPYRDMYDRMDKTTRESSFQSIVNQLS